MQNLCLKKPCYYIAILLVLLVLYYRLTIIYDFQQTIHPKVNSVSHHNLDDSITVKPEQQTNREIELNEMKYILQWTSPSYFLFTYMGKGQQGFIDRKCPYTNCIVTSNRSYLDDISKFDVIAFAGPEAVNLVHDLPKTRSPHQKYVFATIESAHNYPVCSNRFDGYFNWTWTYKLDSEVRWGYMYIKDKDDAILGPNKEINWIKLEEMDPISDDFKKQLRTKSKAAAWFVSNCYSKSNREHLVSKLKSELSKYNLEIDVYGECGKLVCSRDNEDRCDQLIKDKYYFYLAFENAFSEDYVTEKLLRALESDAIPIVYGGAKHKAGSSFIVTSNRSYLDDISKFDVIAFAGPEAVNLVHDLPKTRSPHQKYVFATIESAHNYPVCSNRFDGYFNWTWTYKLDSEVRWGYMYIKDKDDAILGPNKEINWIKLEEMDPISDDFKKQLRTKSKAAAWFVSNCYSKSNREHLVSKLKSELSKYNLEIDVYGECGKLVCSRDNEDRCDQLIKDKYYFYLAFENAFSEDYVTEKLLRALESDAIPIVYGGANYTRFMPDGIYLNARELSVENLAKKMNEIIHDPEHYFEYFKWKKYYSYHRQHTSVHTEPYCLFCTTLNNKEMVKRTTVYKDFRLWWDPPNGC